MSFQEHLAAEVAFTKAEIDALTDKLKQLKRKHRELSRFLSELVNRTDNTEESDNDREESDVC